jgi:hypothetical protein
MTVNYLVCASLTFGIGPATSVGSHYFYIWAGFFVSLSALGDSVKDYLMMRARDAERLRTYKFGIVCFLVIGVLATVGMMFPTFSSSIDCWMVDVTITFDEFPEETSWELERINYNDKNAVLLSGNGTYDGLSRLNDLNGTKKASDCFFEGSYLFAIYDTLGDGFQGSYSVAIDCNVIVQENGFIGTEQITTFDIPLNATTVSTTSKEPPCWDVDITISLKFHDAGSGEQLVTQNKSLCLQEERHELYFSWLREFMKSEVVIFDTEFDIPFNPSTMNSSKPFFIGSNSTSILPSFSPSSVSSSETLGTQVSPTVTSLAPSVTASTTTSNEKKSGQ